MFVFDTFNNDFTKVSFEIVTYNTQWRQINIVTNDQLDSSGTESLIMRENVQIGEQSFDLSTKDIKRYIGILVYFYPDISRTGTGSIQIDNLSLT